MEIFFGCIISIIFFNKDRSSNIVSIFSILILILIVVFYNENNFDRNIITLSIVFLTSLLIIFNNNTYLNKLLSSKILVNVGLISYSLYLIHYPVISFSYIIFTKSNFIIIIFNLLIMFSVAYLINKYIEKPFRNRNFLKQKNIFILFFLISIFLITISLFGLSKTFQKYHINFSYQNIDTKYSSLLLDIKKEGNYVNEKIKFIKKNNVINQDLENILFLGDSQNWDWVRSLYNSDIKKNIIL